MKEFQKQLLQIKQERKPLREQDFEEHQKKFCAFESLISKQQNTLSAEKSISYLKLENQRLRENIVIGSVGEEETFFLKILKENFDLNQVQRNIMN